MRFADGLDTGCGRKGGIRMTPRVLGLRNRKSVWPFAEMRKAMSGVGLEGDGEKRILELREVVDS